jgi:hypothetical protein
MQTEAIQYLVYQPRARITASIRWGMESIKRSIEAWGMAHQASW